jgi:hypothetical protein
MAKQTQPVRRPSSNELGRIAVGVATLTVVALCANHSTARAEPVTIESQAGRIVGEKSHGVAPTPAPSKPSEEPLTTTKPSATIEAAPETVVCTEEGCHSKDPASWRTSSWCNEDFKRSAMNGECPPGIDVVPRNSDEVLAIAYKLALKKGFRDQNGDCIPDVMQEPYQICVNDCSTASFHMWCLFNDPCTANLGTLWTLRSESAQHSTNLFRPNDGEEFECDFTSQSPGLSISHNNDTTIGRSGPDEGESIDPASAACTANTIPETPYRPPGLEQETRCTRQPFTTLCEAPRRTSWTCCRPSERCVVNPEGLAICKP